MSPPTNIIGVLWHAVHEVIILPEGANVIRSDAADENLIDDSATSNVPSTVTKETRTSIVSEPKSSNIRLLHQAMK